MKLTKSELKSFIKSTLVEEGIVGDAVKGVGKAIKKTFMKGYDSKSAKPFKPTDKEIEKI